MSYFEDVEKFSMDIPRVKYMRFNQSKVDIDLLQNFH